ncbi:glycosyltransferase family 2 protein [Microbispora bryophytorum]|uniref:Glycosyl transferase n=1 Tax=Microbispora bryophytorum TaxID=1460882 RepID=A0A8H9L9U6_9ACTN|nr:glycosyltransferase family 2 protein [Microbispora bryophytorum]MBD3139660.1 glycosyltransferase family 2 protein [Microbispora bryophytorum]TQS02943.1 glycosyltransferase family 2 protein [Microbispora bryophytorum]GGO03173.1 glycosyl transferase [Microbispora bryophytorum]
MDTDSDQRADRGIDVSVVVPAYNRRASLDRCLTSLLVQRVAKEIIVVDGGSRDGTRALLRLYAAHHPRLITVIRDAQPGTPGGARNRGLERAAGRYVFFCDAGDHLAPDALARLVAAADVNGADVVVGKVSGARRGLRDSADRASLAAAYDDLSCFKLFRRDFLARHAIHFDETQRRGADMTFTVHAYCHARVISVVADGDCYHAEGGGEASTRDPLGWLRVVRTPIEVMTRHVPPGALRDRLLLRHIRRDVLAQLGTPFLAACEAEREKIAVEVADICGQWVTPGVRAGLDGVDAARVAALDDPDRLVRLALVEAAPLRHRLNRVEWRDDRLVIEGWAALVGADAGADGESDDAGASGAALACAGTNGAGTNGAGLDGAALTGAVGLVVRERMSREERVPFVTRGAAGSFTAVLDVAALSPGVWDVHVVVECEGARRLARLGSRRDPGAGVPSAHLVGGVVAVPFLTRSHGHLGLDVGGHVVRVPAVVRLSRAWWRGRRLRVEGQALMGEEDAAAAVRHLIWRERASGREHRERAVAVGPREFAAETAGLRPGTWDAYLELALGGPPVRFPVKVADADALGRPLRWWCGALRWGGAQWTVRPYATAVNRRLSVSVRVATPLTVVRRMVRLLRRH